MVQDPAFFDRVGPGEVSNRANQDMTTIRSSFGEKLAYLVWSMVTVFAVGFEHTSLLAFS